MKRNLVLITVALTLWAASSVTQASVRKPKPAPAPHAGAHEIYEATEDEVDNLPPPRPLNPDQIVKLKRKAPIKSAAAPKAAPVVRSRELPREKQQQPGIVPTQKAVAAKLAPAPADEAFDLVPSDQMHPLVRRIHLVEEIVRKHARAYDYRIHTIAELEKILAELDAAAAGQPAPKAPEQQPAAQQPSQQSEPSRPSPIDAGEGASLPAPPSG